MLKKNRYILIFFLLSLILLGCSEKSSYVIIDIYADCTGRACVIPTEVDKIQLSVFDDSISGDSAIVITRNQDIKTGDRFPLSIILVLSGNLSERLRSEVILLLGDDVRGRRMFEYTWEQESSVEVFVSIPVR